MGPANGRASVRSGRTMRACAVGVALALLAGACGGDDEPTATEPAATEPAATEPAATEPAATEPAATEPAGTEAPDETATTEGDATGSDDPNEAFPNLAPPTGEPMVLGLVNTEGTPGLDFPEIRLNIASAIDYLNQHGGVGGRPIEIENCTVNGSPETSQACAQELTGKGVELVMVGLDLFPDYATYSAAGVPVIGVLPILPGDYTAEAKFLTGGNATTWAAAVNVAQNHFGATTVGIVSADNAGANSSEAALVAALDKAGIAHTTVKGGDNETDAGYQGLMREAASGEPDLLFSLYSDAGCIGTMRGRASLGIEIPVITTGICSGAEVLDQVGDDAVGWTFIGVSTQEETPSLAILQEIVAPVLGVEPSEVDSTALGLGALGLQLVLSIASFGNQMADAGLEVTGQSIYDWLGTTEGLVVWGTADGQVKCGASADYPSICAFNFPFAEYLEGGEVVTIEGLESVSSLEYMP